MLHKQLIKGIQRTSKPMAALDVYESLYSDTGYLVLKMEFFTRAYLMKRIVPCLKERFVLWLMDVKPEFYDLVASKYVEQYDIRDIEPYQYQSFVDFGILRSYFTMEQNFKDKFDYVPDTRDINNEVSHFDRYVLYLEDFPVKVFSVEATKVGLRWQAMGIVPRNFHLAFLLARISDILDDPEKFMAQLPRILDVERIHEVFDDVSSPISLQSEVGVVGVEEGESSRSIDSSNTIDEKDNLLDSEVTWTENKEVELVRTFLKTSLIFKKPYIYIYPVRSSVIYREILSLLLRFDLIRKSEFRAAKFISIPRVNDVGLSFKTKRVLDEVMFHVWYDVFQGYLKYRYKMEDIEVNGKVEIIKE